PLRSATEPVVLLIDDAHWIDPASEELVRELAAAVHGTRTLLLANFRPEYRPAWLGGSHYHQLPLSPLGPEATRELLHELLGSARRPRSRHGARQDPGGGVHLPGHAVSATTVRLQASPHARGGVPLAAR